MNQLGVGSVLGGRLRLVEPVSSDVTGAVWRAVDEHSGREVAVKALQAHLVGDAVAQARFRLVARTLTQLSHPAIAQVYEYGDGDLGDGIVVPYIVREVVSGQTLEARLENGPLPVGEVLRILGSVADALAVAHRAGIAHGNIEPANIVLGPTGVKVTDFGLAALRGQPSGGPSRSPLAYPAPELASGSAATPASDMYSLGVVFVACLTGIAGGVPGAASAADATDPVPASLAALWAACLGANPQDRPSAAHVAVMSRQIPADRALVPAVSAAGAGDEAEPPAAPPPKRPGRFRVPRLRRGPGIAVGGAVVALAAGVIALTQLPSSPVDRISGPAADSSTVAAPRSPGPSGSVSTSVRSATPEASSPTLASASASASASGVTPLSVIGELSATVRHGMATGQIRRDVGVDFENFIQPVQAELSAGRPADVPQLVSTLRAKLRQRLSEGTISSGIERLMSSELDSLLASAGH
ncbi:MAG TPA: serine/threonine-protein kinase [Streptosporangiaceae bacterium]